MRTPCLCLFCVIVFASIWRAAAFTHTYERGPITLGDDASIYYSVQPHNLSISLALVIHSTNLSVNSSEAWAGFGISEPSSGSMLGSDIVSVEFGGNQTESCTMKDRYVPFTAYPLETFSNGASAVYPVEDCKQNDGSWVLVSCTRNLLEKKIKLEVQRTLGAHDPQDREIGPGQQQIIYAYGNGKLDNHGALRGSKQVFLFNEDLSLPSEEADALPTDFVHKQTIRGTGYIVPHNRDTMYTCTAVEADIPASGSVTLVASDPFVEVGSLAHHFLVYACPKFSDWSKMKTTQLCGGDNEIRDPSIFCNGLLFTWAKGAGRFVLPNNVGFMIDESNKYLVLQTHLDNTQRQKGLVDRSGAILYFGKNRPSEAATLWIGDPFIMLGAQKVKSGHVYDLSCPSECTSVFAEPIHVFGSMQHMHRTGQHISTDRFNKNGSFIESISSIDFWSNEHQHIMLHNPPKVVRPGEQLSTKCVFDTRKRPNTVFGLGTSDEMCMGMLWYYPRQNFSKVKGKIVISNGGSLGRCGLAHQNIHDKPGAAICGNRILMIKNPTINGHVSRNNTISQVYPQCTIGHALSDIPSARDSTLIAENAICIQLTKIIHPRAFTVLTDAVVRYFCKFVKLYRFFW